MRTPSLLLLSRLVPVALSLLLALSVAPSALAAPPPDPAASIAALERSGKVLAARTAALDVATARSLALESDVQRSRDERAALGVRLAALDRSLALARSDVAAASAHLSRVEGNLEAARRGVPEDSVPLVPGRTIATLLALDVPLRVVGDQLDVAKDAAEHSARAQDRVRGLEDVHASRLQEQAAARSALEDLLARRDAAASELARSAPTLTEAEAAAASSRAALASASADLASAQTVHASAAATARSAATLLARPGDGEVSSEYGYRTHPISGRQKLHEGTDLRLSGSDGNVYAAEAGVVRETGYSSSYGNLTVLEHDLQGRRLVTRYAHQASFSVAPGQRVARGQVIGRIGSTGASTGPHLHFEVLEDGVPLDPRTLFTP